MILLHTRCSGATIGIREGVAALLLAALTVSMCAFYFALPADDAYIVARYVRQLYDGNGLVFNPGERINAITSPLLTLALAAVFPIRLDPVDVYRVAATICVAWALVAIALRAYPTRSRGLLFLALTLASPFVCFWSVGGLETPLLLCACSWLTWFALSANGDNGRKRTLQIIGLASAAFLLRNDSALYVAPVTALCLVRYRRDARVVGAAVASAAVVSAWFLFSYVYYGDVFPTSFYVKFSGTETAGDALRGAGYALSFGVVTLVLPMAVACLWRRRPPKGKRPAMLGALVLGAAAETAYALFAGDKHMMYAYRLFVPYLPSFVLLVSGVGISREAPAAERTLFAWVVLCLAYQTLMAACLYYLSENPNLSLVFRRQEVGNEAYEFSTIGARYTGAFLAAVRASANEIQAHWNAVAMERVRPMRIAVLTGGTLPYLLPRAYVLETLVSYRHRCTASLASFADYAQVVHNADAPSSEAQLFGTEGTWKLISAHEIYVNGLQQKAFRLRVDIWYQEHPAPLILPPRVDQPCMGA